MTAKEFMDEAEIRRAERRFGRVVADAIARESASRPFDGYQDQPDTAERTRLAVQSIPFALPEKRR